MTATTAPDPARADLMASLEKRNATFSTLIRLIPSQYYVAPTDEEMDTRWMKNKKRKTGEEIKEHKRRAREEKLDPSNLQASDDEGEAAEPSVVPAPSSGLPPAMPAISALPPAASITDLRDRMRSKLDNFKKDRGIDEEDTDPQSRAALEAARRQRRGEIRDNRRRERKEARRKERAEPTAKTAKQQLLVPQLPRESDSISFPSVALPSSGPRKSAIGIKKLSNPQQALAHLEKHNSKIASLSEEKRKEVEEKERWAKAEERAAGGKVADEEKTLRKAVKREEKRKGKSGKEWNERKETIQRSQAAAIKRRNDNITNRVDAKRNKRLGIKVKEASGKGATKGKGYKGKNPKDEEDRGGKGGKGGKSGKSGKGRPGFEGKSKDRKARSAARA